MAQRSSGWNGTVGALLSADSSTVLDSLIQHQFNVMLMGPDQLQTAAWISCVEMLQRVFTQFVAKRPDAKMWHVAFEYVVDCNIDRELFTHG